MRSSIHSRLVPSSDGHAHSVSPLRGVWLAAAVVVGAWGCGEDASAPVAPEASADDAALTNPADGAALAAAVAPGYRVVDLGTLPGAVGGGVAYAVNRKRQVVGVTAARGPTGQQETHGFVWSNGVMRDLGNLGPVPAPGRAWSQATGINDAGQIVGGANRSNGFTHAFLWTNGVMRDLGTLGGPNSGATAINAVGQVVGWSTLQAAPGAVPVTHAFLWQNGTMKDLGTLGGDYSHAFGINSLGEVVGESKTADGRTHAFRWANGQMTDLLPQGGRSQALATNRSGRVVGASAKGPRATVWVNGLPRYWGPLGEISAAFGINTAGLVVGTTQVNGVSRALIWTKGVMSDLPAAGGGPAHGQAYGVNGAGDVVGVDFMTGHAVLWAHE
jgi:probable HAF family extracellular repeat protein